MPGKSRNRVVAKASDFARVCRIVPNTSFDSPDCMGERSEESYNETRRARERALGSPREAAVRVALFVKRHAGLSEQRPAGEQEQVDDGARSEERRVGQECRSRW